MSHMRSIAAVVVVCLAAPSIPAAETHVHVIRVDAVTPEGSPLPNLRVYYGLSGDRREYLGTTSKNGIADGTIKPELFGKKLKLYVVADTGPLATKSVEWEGDDDLTRGFVVSIIPSRAPVTYDNASTTYGPCTPTSYCDDFQMYSVPIMAYPSTPPNCNYMVPAGVYYYQPYQPW